MNNLLDIETEQARIIRVVDIETTGFADDDNSAICEIGWIDVDVQLLTLGNPVTFFVNPGHPITPATQQVHHISDKDVEGAVTPMEAVTKLHQGLSKADVLCAHNSAFEKAFLGTHRRWICTLKAAYKIWPEFEKHNNQFLRYQLSLDSLPSFSSDAAMPPHRALPDAYTTAHILLEQFDHATVGELVELEQRAAILPRMPIGKHRGKTFKEVAETDRGYLSWIVHKSGMDPKNDADLIATAKHWLNGGDK